MNDEATLIRKKTFIDTIKDEIKAGKIGKTGTDYFQLAEIRQGETRDGRQSQYLDITFSDRTGRISGKKWDTILMPGLKSGMIVKVDYAYDQWKDNPQLKVNQMRAIEPELERAEIEDFLPVSKRDRDEMMRELSHWIGGIENLKLKDALIQLTGDLHDKLKHAPAAKSKHHACIGGLMEHNLNLLGLVKGVCAVHPALNKDVLVAGAILHDIGKCYELEYTDHIDYTLEGNIIGHVVQGLVVWARYYSDVDMATRMNVAHIILSHHGEGKWGAPVEPKTKEAWVFHFLDNLDAKLNMVEASLATTDDKGLTAWDKDFNARLWDGLGGVGKKND